MLKGNKACEQYLLFGQTNENRYRQACGQARVQSPVSISNSKIHHNHRLDCVLATREILLTLTAMTPQ